MGTIQILTQIQHRKLLSTDRLLPVSLCQFYLTVHPIKQEKFQQTSPVGFLMSENPLTILDCMDLANRYHGYSLIKTVYRTDEFQRDPLEYM